MAEVFELRPHFEWRGLGFISQSALKLSAAYADLDAELRFCVPGRPRRRPEGVPVRRGAQGRHQAVGVQGVRHRLHARARDRHLHGLAGGRLCRLLQLRALRARACRLGAPSAEERILGIIETARAKRPRFKDERITMAHGAGGKATQTLIEGLLAPAFGIDELGRRARACAGPRADHRLVRGQAAAVPGRLDRRARGQRHGQRPGDGRRAPARAQPLADPRGGPRRRRAARRGRARSPPRPTRPACGSSPATPRSSSAATPTDVRLHDRARPARPARRAVAARAAPGRPDPVSGPIGDHGMAIMLARGEFGLDADDRVGHALAVARGRRADRGGRPVAARAARRDARRRRLRAQRARPRLGRRDRAARGRRAGGPGRGGRGGDPRDRPDVRRQRGQARRVRRAGARGRGAGRAARRARLRAGRRDRRSEDGTAGDGAGEDGVRRPSG